MATYMVQASYTQQAIASLIKQPQNRSEVVRKAIEKLGGKLVGLWLSFGDQDVVVIAELPDNVSAAAMSLAVAGGGALRSSKTTVLFTVAEGMTALKKAASSGYTSFTAKK
jgi:uncharacterized protein with GYD domain